MMDDARETLEEWVEDDEEWERKLEPVAAAFFRQLTCRNLEGNSWGTNVTATCQSLGLPEIDMETLTKQCPSGYRDAREALHVAQRRAETQGRGGGMEGVETAEDGGLPLTCQADPSGYSAGQGLSRWPCS